MTDAPDERLVELAHQMFDLAREGEGERLAAYVDAGVPVVGRQHQQRVARGVGQVDRHAATVALLVARGADADRVNDRGQSPLAGAVFKDEQDVVRTLVEAGADPDAGTPSARATAAMFGRPDLFG